MPTAKTDHPDIIMAPPLYPAIALVLAVMLDLLAPISLFPVQGLAAWNLWVGLVLAVPGAMVVFRSIGLFNAAGTNVSPHQPTESIVTDGPYRFTRNPIYLGCLAFHLALNLILALEWGLVLLPFVWLAFDRLVVVKEEAYLTRKFGEAYLTYCARTRRWI